MRRRRVIFLIISSWFFLFGSIPPVHADEKLVQLILAKDIQPRVAFGVDSLVKTLISLGYQTKVRKEGESIDTLSYQLVIGKMNDPLLNSARNRFPFIPKEGYTIQLGNDLKNYIVAADDTGLLYGCLELTEKCRQEKKIPIKFQRSD